jgi:hypothetical protein
MQKLKLLLLLLAFIGSTAFAAESATASAPTDESIRELLTVTEAQKLADDVIRQMEEQMRARIGRSLHGKQLDARQQKVIDDYVEQVVRLMRKEMAWESLEPAYIRIYRESFSQDEIDGMVAFYRTPAGQAVVRKMPVVMKQSMLELQARMGPLMLKLHAIQQKAITDLKLSSGQ